MKSRLKKIRNWWLVNSSRVHLEERNRAFANQVGKSDYVLDAGAGTAPYRDLFSHANYETADFEQVDKKYRKSTYVCDLSSIPVEDGRFDFVVFNQVMEHLPEPAEVLRELGRVMKPKGKIICSCPLFYEEHEQPYDFYRYTQFAHEHLFKSAGFEILKIDWLEGYFGTVAYQFECMFKYLPLKPADYSSGVFGWLAAPFVICSKLAALILAGIFYRLDLQYQYRTLGMPKNYVVIAQKM